MLLIFLLQRHRLRLEFLLKSLHTRLDLLLVLFIIELTPIRKNDAIRSVALELGLLLRRIVEGINRKALVLRQIFLRFRLRMGLVGVVRGFRVPRRLFEQSSRRKIWLLLDSHFLHALRAENTAEIVLEEA